MVDLGKHVVGPVLMVGGMVVGLKTMERVASVGSHKRRKKGAKKKTVKVKSYKRKRSIKGTYYCRKCKVRHKKTSKIGKAHKR